jgi:hypothetical protein
MRWCVLFSWESYCEAEARQTTASQEPSALNTKSTNVFRWSFQTFPVLQNKQKLSSCGEGVREHRALVVERGGQGIAAKLSVFETKEDIL